MRPSLPASGTLLSSPLAALLAVLLAVLLPAPLYAQAVLIPDADPEALGACTNAVAHEVEVSVTNAGATSRISQTLRVPDGGLSAWVLLVGEEATHVTATIDGEALETTPFVAADTARLLEASARRPTPELAALTHVGRIFHARVDLAAGEHVIVTERHVPVDWSASVPHLEVPLRSYGTTCGAPSADVTVHVESDVPIGAVFTPFHDRDLERESETTAAITSRRATTAHDFSLYLLRSNETVAAGSLTYRDASCGRQDDLGFMALAAGPTITEARDELAKEIAFVIDTSGSMAGDKIEQVKRAMRSILENLQTADRFELITFSSGVEPLFGRLAEVTEEDRMAEANARVNALEADGGTNIHDALLQALDELSSRGDMPRLVVFLTDGQATTGVTDVQQILEAVRQRNEFGARIYSFGVGDSVNTTLLDGLARDSGATSNYIRPGSDIDATLAAFYGEIKAPIATDVELLASGIQVLDRYPESLPDLFVGTNLVALSRYVAATEYDLALAAKTEQGYTRFGVGGDVVRHGTEHSFVPRLWASRRLGELLYEARQNGGDEATVDAIRELARRYGFVTPWTPLTTDASGNVGRGYSNPTGDESGSNAVGTSAGINDITANNNAGAYGGAGVGGVRQVLDRTFLRMHGYWTDTRLPETLDEASVIDVRFASQEWTALVQSSSFLSRVLAVGRSVIVEHKCQVIRVTDPEEHEGDAPDVDRVPEELLEDPSAENELIPQEPGQLEAVDAASCQGVSGTGAPWALLIGLMALACRRRRWHT